MRTVLSTKILAPHQKNLLLNSGIALVEYNAIKIEFIKIEGQAEVINGIITSQNAAKAVIDHKLNIQNCFCVGEKTAGLLRENNYKVVEVADYGKLLAERIVEKFSSEDFSFFCGNMRREEVPSILRSNGIKLVEIEVYRTFLNLKEFNQEFDGLMFFSPSGVKSYLQKNSMKSSTAFCIGTTTAAEAGKFTDNIIIATKPSVENLVVQVVKKYKT